MLIDTQTITTNLKTECTVMNITKPLGYCAAYSSLLALSGCQLMGNGAPTLSDLIAEHALKGSTISETYRKIGMPDQVEKLTA
ncbi:hypothetical protein [Pseudomonas asplenii]|uniref:hypothetical protein n=1 Tax=Pseudomonas asplenii TaxID=53407 RepID=UPI0012BD4252|nr:hypothetical protein [Pseudomonas fuscovaginae]